MLVLSRRETETIVFPAIQTSIELLKVRGNVVRVGIKAPKNLKVLRGELAAEEAEESDGTQWFGEEPDAEGNFRRINHDLRNRLNAITVGLGVIRRQLDAGLLDAARQTLKTAVFGLAGEAAEPELPAAVLTEPGELHALVVEDNANERHLLAGLLRSSGIRVDTVGDGAQAIDYLDARRPDFVLMDMLMPQCDGATAVRMIRSNPRHEGLKIFAVSGTHPRDVGLDNGPQGVDRWFQKPLDTEMLVSELCRGHRDFSSSGGVTVA